MRVNLTNGTTINLPNPNPHFVGREDKIQEVVHALSSRAWIIGIDGMGGIGKTTLALEVAHLCKKRNTDHPDLPHFTSYIWVSARNKPNFGLGDVIREILYVLSAFEINKRKLSEVDQLSLASRALSTEPRLLIIDNFESIPEDEFLYQFLRELPSPSKVLITSRLRINTGEEVLTLGGLAENDAVKLLRLEANRLRIPIDERDMIRLRVIARKSFGIPFVLRWVMERVREGQTLEWAVKSLENATAEDIFEYIFSSSLSLLDLPTREIFCSMSLLATWTKTETIQAMNPRIAAVPDRVGDLVKYSLIEDNLRLTQNACRYQLHPFTQYLARKELSGMDDRGASIVRNALEYYLTILKSFSQNDQSVSEYLAQEFANVQNIVQFASQLNVTDMIDQCIEIFGAIQKLDSERGKGLRHYLTKLNDPEQVFKLFGYVPNPYSTGTPMYDKSMFFGREELFRSISEFERAVLFAAARSIEGKSNFFNSTGIDKLLDDDRIAEIDKVLYALERKDLIIADKQRRYRFSIELFRRWLLEQNIGNERGMMNMDKPEQNEPTTTNTTHIGYVAGPTHTGSGDIVIDTLSYEGAISTKEEFLAALRAFKGELEVARQKGLPEEIYDDTTIEIEAAEREARKDASKPDRVINRLEKAKTLLTAGTSVAVATTSLIETSSKLVPLIEAAIQAVGKIFT